MSTKHTPGPWELDGYGVYDSTKECISRVYDIPRPKGMRKENIQANARLIAAAPELLGWLKSAQEHLESYRQYSEAMASELGRGHVPSSQFSPAYLAAAIEQVINKATEGQQ